MLPFFFFVAASVPRTIHRADPPRKREFRHGGAGEIKGAAAREDAEQPVEGVARLRRQFSARQRPTQRRRVRCVIDEKEGAGEPPYVLSSLPPVFCPFRVLIIHFLIVLLNLQAAKKKACQSSRLRRHQSLKGLRREG